MYKDLEKAPTHDLLNHYGVGENNFEIVTLNEIALTESPLVETPDIEIHQPDAPLLLVPIGLLAIAWSISLSRRLGFSKTSKKNIGAIKHQHKIPCGQCRYFENDPYLKCAVHPLKASNLEAIDCSDFAPSDTKRFYSY